MNDAINDYKNIIEENREINIQSAKEHQEYIKNYTARYHGLYVRTLYMPKMFDKKAVAYIEENALIMYRILVKVVENYRKNAQYRKLFGFDERLETLILREKHYQNLLPMARIDIFFNEDDYSFKFCEFNTDGSSAMNEDKELNEAIRLTHAYKRFSEKYDIRTYELFDTWVREFKRIYSTYDRAVSKPYVAIVDFYKKDDINKEFYVFKSAFEKAGLECEICNIADLRYENGSLISPCGRKIDAVYRRAVTRDIMDNYEKVGAFIQAAADNAVCIIGDFMTQVIHNKIVFKVLLDPMTSSFLTPDERRYVREHIPYTVSLTEQALRENDVLTNKDKWVIKPEDSYASRGVFAGVEFENNDEWVEAVKKNTDNHYLLQEFVQPYGSLNINLASDTDAEFKKYSNITGIYMYGGKFAGLYSRIAKAGIISTQYSEMTLPTIVVEKK